MARQNWRPIRRSGRDEDTGRGGDESRTRGDDRSDARQWRGGYGEAGAGEPPRYRGSQPGYGAHGMGYGPQRGDAWGVYGVPREEARGYADASGAGAPTDFDQPHGRMPYGWTGSFGSAGEHGSRAEGVRSRERERGRRDPTRHPGGAGAGEGGLPGQAPQYRWQGEGQRRGPKGYQRSDERIRELLYERLSEADRIDASDVTIEVKDGHVILHGSVAHRQMKYWIEDIAADTFGVSDVENKLRVALTAPWPATAGRGARS